LRTKQTNLELESYYDKTVEANRTELKQAYDEFVKKYGAINLSNNKRLINNVPSSSLILALYA